MPQFRGIRLGLALFDKLVNTKQFVGKNQVLSSGITNSRLLFDYIKLKSSLRTSYDAKVQ
jgi:hypothetical protein